VLFLLLV